LQQSLLYLINKLFDWIMTRNRNPDILGNFRNNLYGGVWSDNFLFGSQYW